MEPSAKGSVVSETVAALRRLREKGRVGEPQLAARLSKATGRPLAATARLGPCLWE